MKDAYQFFQSAFKHTKQSKQIKKCLEVLKSQHYYYSCKSSKDQIGPHYNSFSVKVGVTGFKKLQVFDMIPFAHHSEQIKFFSLCSTLKQWYVAVFHSRVLQIFDQVTGSQEYEINMPSCKGVHFMDQEKLIILQDGASNVYVCSIEMQKRLFAERHSQKHEVKTANYAEEDYTGGLRFQKDDFEDVEFDDLKNTAGVKVIRYDEDVKGVFCTKNTSPYGYLAILGKRSISLYMAYADEGFAVYDHLWTLMHY